VSEIDRIKLGFGAFALVLVSALWLLGGGWSSGDSDEVVAAVESKAKGVFQQRPSSVSFTAVKSFQGGERRVNACVRFGTSFYEVRAVLKRDDTGVVSELAVGDFTKVPLCFGLL
jgi:hypothetical protein